MDVDKELDELFRDPLLDVSYQEAKLFDIPADMMRVMEGRRLQPEHKAQRKRCEDFAVFKPLFKQVQLDLKEGKRSLLRVTKTADYIQEKRFYVIDGMLVYVSEIGNLTKDRSGKGHNKDARTRCIYENGMESDVLVQSLRRAIYANGYGITEPQENIDRSFEQIVEAKDISTGYIYVLRSLSTDPAVTSVKDLYKIGFTVNKVEERIANAENEPTYLMAPVEIKATAQIVNMNSQMFETLVHQVFSAVQFQVTVYDDKGDAHVPTEWYVAPLDIIMLVIQKIADGTITQYSYNAEMQCLEKRIVKNKSMFNTQGLRVLNLNVKAGDLALIVSGEKTSEKREIKQNTLNKFTYIDDADHKRYLRRYDVIRFNVGKGSGASSALMEVKDITCKEGVVEFKLGRVLEHVNNDREAGEKLIF